MILFMRLFYSLAVYAATPMIFLYLAWRGLRNPSYFKRWRERLGWSGIQPSPGGILVHAVSVGEVNGVLPLVREIMQRWPRRSITITTVTPTGSERVISIFGDQVHHAYLPIDLPGAVRRLFDRIQPAMVVVMETEIWPNLYLTAAKREIPLVLVNARLSRHSASGYRRFLPQAALALDAVTAIAAQTAEDAKRFIQAGAARQRVHVCGNLKCDVPLPGHIGERSRHLADQWGALRPVWMAASTHEGEEQAALDAHRQLLRRLPQALLIVVPRHPERFVRVAALIRQAGFALSLHSAAQAPQPATEVILVDAMGVLLDYAAAADLVFVGGSLLPVGGHNPLEPAALAKPVIMGPYHENTVDSLQLLVGAGGARLVENDAALAAVVSDLMPRKARLSAMGGKALEVVEKQRGTVMRTVALISEVWPGGNND